MYRQACDNDRVQGHGLWTQTSVIILAMEDFWLNHDQWTTDWLTYMTRLDRRHWVEINTVIIHATELPTLAMAREYAEIIHYTGSQTGNSGHFYIEKNGETHCWVRPDYIAHHTRGYNQTSIGIELVHLGRYPQWLATDQQSWTEPYPDEQITALVSLLKILKQALPQLHHIAGHDELDTTYTEASDDSAQQVRRKMDPGPTFPWTKVLAESGLTPLKPAL